MNAIKSAVKAGKCLAPREGRFIINPYPLLAIVLAIVLAALTYGGLFLILF